MTIFEQINIVAWGVVSIAAGFTALSRKCHSIAECVVIAAISMAALGKVWLYVRQEVSMDPGAFVLGCILAVYFVMKAERIK